VESIAKLLKEHPLKEHPAAEKYRSALEVMEGENARLKAENAELKEELAQFIQKWETLDWDAVRTLQYLFRHEHGQASEIAQASQMNIHIVESQLKFLLAYDFIARPVNGEPRYGVNPKGRRYLRERGLI
jgi:hypothetical protein